MDIRPAKDYKKPLYAVGLAAAVMLSVTGCPSMPVIIPAEDVTDWLFEPKRTQEFLQTVPPKLTSEREYEQISLFETMLLEKQ